MKNKNKKITSGIVAGSLLVANTPIATFANEIEEVIGNIEIENLNEEEILLDDSKEELKEISSSEDINNIEENINESDFDNSLISNDIVSNEIVHNETESNEVVSNEVKSVEYTISSIEDLKELRHEVNDNDVDTTGMIFKLGADIDFSGETDWESIGSMKNSFKGNFDGNGYEFKNLNITSTLFGGIFGVSENSNFENIIIKDFNINSRGYVSSLALLVSLAKGSDTFNNITIENSSLKGLTSSMRIGGVLANTSTTNKVSLTNIDVEVSIEGGYDVGGIVGIGKVDISNANVNINATGSEYYAGGVVGRLYDDNNAFNFENINVSGQIIDSVNIGGVICATENYNGQTVIIKDTFLNNFLLKPKTSSSNARVAGFIAQANSSDTDITIESCGAKNLSIKTNHDYVGGIVSGTYAKVKIKDVNIEGSISGKQYVGGFLGQSTNDIIVEDSSFKGEVNTTSDYTGGLVGMVTNNGVGTFNNNTIEADISSTGDYVGGMIGSGTKRNIVFDSNSFKGNLNGTRYVAGIGGFTPESPVYKNNIVEADILGTMTHIGGFTGHITGTKAEVLNNTFKGSVEGNGYVAGGIGFVAGNEIIISNNEILGDITGKDNTGGLVGHITPGVGTIEDNDIRGKVIGANHVGGVGGFVTNSNISRNAFEGSVSGNSKVGGFVGYIVISNLENNYAIASVNGKQEVAGFIGYSTSNTHDKVVINNAYSASTVIGEQNVSSFVFKGAGNIEFTNTYYDNNLSSIVDDYAQGLDTSVMQGKVVADNLGFSFGDVWKMNKEYYPTFKQINTAPEIKATQEVIDSTINIKQFDKFDFLDYIEVDDFEGDEVTVTLKGDIVSARSIVDTSKYGEYPITYVATDEHGLSSELTLSVKVTPVMIGINSAPILTIKEIVLTQGQKYNLLDYATANDKEDGDITKDIKVIEDNIKIDTPGEYKVVYEVSDKDGAKAIKEVKVIVKAKENTSVDNKPTNKPSDKPVDKPSDKPVDKPTEKPQTGDLTFVSVMSVIASLMGLSVINRKKED